jgi:hypothetical protein
MCLSPEIGHLRFCPQCQQPLTQFGRFWVCPEHGQAPTDALAASIVPLRIFLNYGHDANEGLVRLNSDMYDGVFLAIHDLSRRVCVFNDESLVNRKADIWRVSLFGDDNRLSAVVSQPDFDRKTVSLVIDLATGAKQEGPCPANARNVNWIDAFEPADPAHLCLRDHGLTFCLPPDGTREPATFSAEARIRLAQFSSDGQLLVIACDTGQLHFLDARGPDTDRGARSATKPP